MSIKSTSHLRDFSSAESGSKFPTHLSDLVSSCSYFSGLAIMGDRFERNSLNKLATNSTNKKNQVQDFIDEVESSDADALLFVLLSNDYKTFLTNKGHMLKINPTAKDVWRQLSPKEKINYNVQIHKPLQKQSRIHIETQFENYEVLLKAMLSKTNIKDFCHSSVLERINHNIKDLPFYFTIFNSFLRKNIETWDRNRTFKNKNGHPIKCHFINVADQFFNAIEPEELFVLWERKKFIELTHRTIGSYEDLVDKWKAGLKKCLNLS